MNVFSACVKTFLLLNSSLLWAADKTVPALQPANYSMRIVFFLLIVVGCILLLAWLLNKSKLGAGFSGQSHSQLKIVAVVPLGLKEKIAVLQVGEQQVLVGITPHSINYLTELEQPLSKEELRPAAFSDLLKKAMRS